MSANRILVIETATAACSVALFEQDEIIAAAHEIVGRGHAERLIPMIAALPDAGRAGRIMVDCGPGSFTGVRVGLAAACGFAIGWNASVAGFSSLASVAAGRFAAADPPDRLAVVLEGGHGEVFMQSFSAVPFRALGPMASRKPDAALAELGAIPAFGSGTARLTAIDPSISAAEALPDAADARLLPAEFANLPAKPIYGRAPDARPAGT